MNPKWANATLCGAKNRSGETCKKPVKPGHNRCHLHGANAGRPVTTGAGIRRTPGYKSLVEQYLNDPQLRNLDRHFARLQAMLQLMEQQVGEAIEQAEQLSRAGDLDYLDTLDKPALVRLCRQALTIDRQAALQAHVAELRREILVHVDAFFRVLERETRIETARYQLSVAQTQLFQNELLATICDVTQQIAAEFTTGRITAVTAEELRDRCVEMLTQRMQRNTVMVPLKGS